MRYLDTSSLVALYFPETKTKQLVSHLRRHPLPLLFTWLHEVELTNGLQLKRFRNEASASAVSATLDALRGDLESGVLNRVQPSWAAILAATLRLSTSHSHTLGTRTLDLLHVAAALTMGAAEFVTGDERQAKAAKREGMKVLRF